MAATNKCLAHSNKSRTGGKATKKRNRARSVVGNRMKDMKMKAIGNLILMTLICVAVFIVFMAIRPARTQHWQFTPWGPQFSIAAYGPAGIPPGFQAPPLSDPYAHARAANQHCMARKMCDAALRLWGIL
jgi:hypothetical protein